MVNRIIWTSIGSILVNLFVKKSWFEQNRIIWSILVIELAPIFGISLIDVCNNIENRFNGSIMFAILTLFTEMHAGCFFDWTEDIIFQDLNLNYKLYNPATIYQNMSVYLAYLVGIPTLFLVQFYHTGDIVRNSNELNVVPLRI